MFGRLLLLASLLLIGCFDPPQPLCQFSCALPPNECPVGYECRIDRYCHKIGTSGACPGFPGPEASVPMVDAAMDAMDDAPDAATDAPMDGPATD